MQHYANNTLIKRNGRLSRGMIYLGLGLTIAAAIIVFREPNFVLLALILMLTGGLISQIGTALFNRFGREPRMDQIIDASLKGLDDRYAIFHYLLGTDHVLVTPEGVFSIIPRLEEGEINYRDNKWYHKKPRGRLTVRNRERALRGFEKEAFREANSVEQSLQKNLESGDDINVQPLVVFVAKEVNLDLGETTLLATHRKKLKDMVRSLERGKSLEKNEIKRLADTL
jgi:hypothetical protein